jgi:hypothetical protein
MSDADEECPACGGSGGGPFGRPGSAWDVETYACPRCGGTGVVPRGLAAGARPLAKGKPKAPALITGKRGPVSTRPAASKPSASKRSAAGGKRSGK